MDQDRNREFRRKKYSSHKEKEDKPVKILLKPKEGEKSRKDEDVTPVVLLKNKEAVKTTAPSQCSQNKVADQKEPIQIHQTHAKAHSDGSHFPRPPTMKQSTKLIDFDTMYFQDGLVDYLTDSTDFLVVGCLGLQGVGKSTLLSHLAFPLLDGQQKNSNLVFKPQSKNHIDSGCHCTEGVDAFITCDRIIFLDAMPVFSLSVLSKCQSGESGFKSSSRDDPQQQSSFLPNTFTNENDVEIMSLQLASFLFAVCHVVIIAQDFSFDAEFMRFLQTAEMLKPSSGMRSEDDSLIEYFPHFIFVHNQAHQMAFKGSQFKNLQACYKQMFSKSQLPIQSGVGIGHTMVSLSLKYCGEPLNLFILPNYTAEEKEYQVAIYEDLLQELRGQILGLGSSMLTHTALTEKNWYHYAAKIWEDVKRSQLFPEYNRLLPSSYASKSDA